jgi:DNA-binding MarR family transcriptional regulator
MKINKFLDESPLFNLALAYNEIIGDFQKQLSREDVHFIEALIITGLFFEDRPVRPTELAHTFSVSKSNLSHSLRALEKQKLVERKTAPEDARAYFFSLSKEGSKRAQRLIKLFDSTEDRLEKTFGGRKINPSLKLFRKVYWESQLST